jgi:hypothetical protein
MGNAVSQVTAVTGDGKPFQAGKKQKYACRLFREKLSEETGST